MSPFVEDIVLGRERCWSRERKRQKKGREILAQKRIAREYWIGMATVEG